MSKFLGFAMVASLLLLSGCGFHLKGQGGASAEIQAGSKAYWRAHPLIILDVRLGETQLAVELRKALQFEQIAFSSERSLKDDYAGQTEDRVLWLAKPYLRFKETAQSITGVRTAEFIRWDQAFELRSGDGKLLLNGTLQVLRDRQLDPANPLASESEKQQILQSMSKEMARQLVHRLNGYGFQQSQVDIK